MKILQMIPAPKWVASYVDPERPMAENHVPLICWALIDRLGEQVIVGMVLDNEKDILPADGEDFEGYLYKGAGSY